MIGPLIIPKPKPPADLVYLIAHAPAEIPDWFEPEMEPAPQCHHYTKICSTDEVKAEVRSYIRPTYMYSPGEAAGPEYNELSEEAKRVVDLMDEQRVKADEWKGENRKQRVLQWPVYWAKQMLELAVRPCDTDQ